MKKSSPEKILNYNTEISFEDEVDFKSHSVTHDVT